MKLVVPGMSSAAIQIDLPSINKENGTEVKTKTNGTKSHRLDFTKKSQHHAVTANK